MREFAEYLGFKQSTISMWWTGKNIPSEETVLRRLADRLGLEVYDALGLDRPDEDLLWFMNNWDLLPKHVRTSMKSLREQAEQYNAGRQQHDTKPVPKAGRT